MFFLNYKSDILYILVCKDGLYNVICFVKCGYCIRREMCEKYDGICINGCS